MFWKKAIRLIDDLYCRYEDDEVTALGAQMTYYFILAFFPFLIFLMSLAGYTPLTSEEVLANMADFIPETSALIIVGIVRELLRQRNDALISIGMIATFWAASNGITAMIKGLNKAYDEAETRPWWKIKGIALLFTLAVAAVILLSFSLLVFGHLLGEQMLKLFKVDDPQHYEAVWRIFKYVIPGSVMVVVFMFLYRYVPNRRLTFRGVLPGSMFASFGWIATSLLFSFYVNSINNYSGMYGSIGGIIVLLIWLYLSSILILIGGEINATLTFDKEGRKKPKCKPFSRRLVFWKKSLT